jgi:hypothetical protein
MATNGQPWTTGNVEALDDVVTDDYNVEALQVPSRA